MESQEQVDCKKIEEHIKSMIFSNHLENSHVMNFSPPERLHSHISESMLNSNETTLIDNAALMKFVSETLQEPIQNEETEQFSSPIISDSLNSSLAKQDSAAPHSSANDDQLTDSPKTKKKKKKKTNKKTRKRIDSFYTKLESHMKNASQDSSQDDSFDGKFSFEERDGNVFSIINNKGGAWQLECSICNHSEIAGQRFSHLLQTNHDKNLKKCIRKFMLQNLPTPLPQQCEAITETIMDLHKNYGLSNERLIERKLVSQKLNELISQNFPDCKVELIGSSVSGCGLKSSEVDMVLVVTRHLAAERLMSVFELIKKKEEYNDTTSYFDEKIPKVTFIDVAFNLKCNLLLLDIKTCPPIHILLSIYVNLDSRVLPLITAFRYLAQICRLDQPDIGTLPPLAFPLMVIYFLQKQSPRVLPSLQQNKEFSLDGDYETFLSKLNWISMNTESIGSLWVKLLKYYCYIYKPGEEIVSIRNTELACAEKRWGTKFLAIEDPIEAARNFAHTIPNKCIYKYIMDTLVNAHEYFGHPQFINPDFTVKVIEDINNEPSTTLTSEEQSESTESILIEEELLEDHDADLPFDDVISTISKLTMDDINSEEDDKTNDNVLNDYKDVFACDKNELPLIEKKEDFKKCDVKFIWFLNSPITKDLMIYKFEPNLFTKGAIIPLICRSCNTMGHLKKDCPEEILPPVQKLPPVTLEQLNALTEVCRQVRSHLKPSEKTIHENEMERQTLEKIVRGVYADAEIELFGSYCNGFGFEHSDLDFCLTFQHNKNGENLVHKDIIENLAQKLLTYPFYSDVQPIVGAKVPIVKFVNTRHGHRKECDISVYNTLAKYNTKMLQSYCAIDNRVQTIGYMIKHLAKILDICDASKGSLSSYAYVLMAIYFLQQCKPPVLPVLQELYTGEKPTILVDDWNVWFFDDLNRLHEIWPEYGQNKQSVGQLWLNLLNFYADEFDFSKHVIAIKQKKPLTRFSKLWQNKKIAIEDPFDLNHNLGAGLSRKMSLYIRKSFIFAREHFNRQPSYSPSELEGLTYYLFNRQLITKGLEPPIDRRCRVCGKIGHYAKDCPVEQNRRKRRYDKQRPMDRNSTIQPQNLQRPNFQQAVGPRILPHQLTPGQRPLGGLQTQNQRLNHSSLINQRSNHPQVMPRNNQQVTPGRTNHIPPPNQRGHQQASQRVNPHQISSRSNHHQMSPHQINHPEVASGQRLNHLQTYQGRQRTHQNIQRGNHRGLHNQSSSNQQVARHQAKNVKSQQVFPPPGAVNTPHRDSLLGHPLNSSGHPVVSPPGFNSSSVVNNFAPGTPIFNVRPTPSPFPVTPGNLVNNVMSPNPRMLISRQTVQNNNYSNWQNHNTRGRVPSGSH